MAVDHNQLSNVSSLFHYCRSYISGRPKKSWGQIVEKYCRARGLNREDAMHRARWRKLIGMIDDYDESSG